MSSRKADRLLMQALAIVLAILALLPFLWLLVMSFKTNAEIFRWPPRLLFPATLANYAALWTSEFRGSFANSLVVSVASTVVSLVIGVPAAYALSRWTTRGGATVTLWILASRMAPPIAFTIPYFLAYRYLELLDTLTGLILIYLSFNLSPVVSMMRPGSTAPPCGRASTGSSCPSAGRASRRPQSSASCSPGTTSSSP